jgi:hypothetical protein
VVDQLADAAQRSNAAAVRRLSCGGRWPSRRRRGTVLLAGDFNCCALRSGPGPLERAEPGACSPPAACAPQQPQAVDLDAECRVSAAQGRGHTAVPSRGGGGAASAAWKALERRGWSNVLAGKQTNWRASKAAGWDAVCVRQEDRTLVMRCGVCAPPPYVDGSQPGTYPNHLCCYVLLDCEGLQGAPGKLRPLAAPSLAGKPS